MYAFKHLKQNNDSLPQNKEDFSSSRLRLGLVAVASNMKTYSTPAAV